MATVVVAAWKAGAGQASATPTLQGVPRAVESVTTTSSNQVSAVRAYRGEVLALSVNGNAVRVAVAEGADPIATTPQAIVADGSTFVVQAMADDFRVALVDV